MASVKEVEDTQDFKVLSSVNDIRQFMNSPLWADMKGYIEMQNKADHQRLVKAETMDDIRKLQGKLEVGEEMLNLPDFLITLLTDSNDNG